MVRDWADSIDDTVIFVSGPRSSSGLEEILSCGNSSPTSFSTETFLIFCSTSWPSGCSAESLKTIGVRRKFLFYFFFCGIGAGICTVIFSPYQLIPVIGASGAIYGILLAFGWLFPNRLIYIYFLFPIPAKYFVLIYGFLEFIYFSRGGTGGGVAHLTHLGGLLFGLIYMAYPMVRQKIRREYYKRKWSQRGPGNGGYYH